MSRREREPKQGRDALLDKLTLLAGNPVFGGCDDCDAYQTIDRHASGVYALTVHHDATCPYLLGVIR